jgi:integrase
VADYRDHTGKRHWETFSTRKAAEQGLAVHLTAIKNGKYAPANDRRTVADAYKSWWTLSVEGSDNKNGAPLRPTTQALYSMTWRTHVDGRWGRRKLVSIGAEEISQWREEMLTRHGAKTVLNAVQLLGSLFRHARRFQWIGGNPVEDVRKPRYRSRVRAFSAEEIATLLEHADAETALLIRTAASTGLRFGELAGLRWRDVDLTEGTVRVSRQFTHGAWSELKTDNARRQVPVPNALRRLLRTRYEALNGNVVLRGPDERLVFPGPSGQPLDRHNCGPRGHGPDCLPKPDPMKSTPNGSR